MKMIFEAVRVDNGSREVFRSATTPTHETHGQTYKMVTGPFKTLRAARFMAVCQDGSNPHLQTVADAERISKKYGDYKAEYAGYRARFETHS